MNVRIIKSILYRKSEIIETCIFLLYKTIKIQEVTSFYSITLVYCNLLNKPFQKTTAIKTYNCIACFSIFESIIFRLHLISWIVSSYINLICRTVLTFEILHRYRMKYACSLVLDNYLWLSMHSIVIDS